MKGVVILIIIGMFIISAAVYSLYAIKEKSSNIDIDSNPLNVPIQAIKITYDNLDFTLSKTNMIKDLPKDAIILLHFYNFNTGEREIEKSYVFTLGEIKEGVIENEDIAIYIHSKYLNELTTANFCSVIQEANSNGDLGTEKKISNTALLWKYKSMLKYRSCLGL
jgi:hypothetical protein